MKTNFLLSISILLLVLSGYAQNANSQASENQETVLKIYRAFDDGNTDALENYIAKDAIDHSEMSGMKSTGLEAVKEMCKMQKTAFPDMKTSVRTIASAGDTVMAYYVTTGTNTGMFMGKPATNKKIEMEGVDIIRFKDGKAVEHWGVYDNMKMMQQLGYMPIPPMPPAKKKVSK